MSTTAAARVMARGRHIELRLWERDPAGERAFEPDEAHEHVAYVQAGALIVSIGERPTARGPRGRLLRGPGRVCGHRFEVLEPTTVVEAISPSDRLD